jgi:hypothetical protein
MANKGCGHPRRFLITTQRRLWGQSPTVSARFIGGPLLPVAIAAAVRRNQVECEDQCAAAANFMIRFMAAVSTTLDQFMAQLTPEQRTPVREAGLKKARGGAAEMIEGTIIWVAQGMKPDNARLLTAALRETENVWAAYITPDDRTRVLGMLVALQKIVKDHETGDNLAAFAAALTAEH